VCYTTSIHILYILYICLNVLNFYDFAKKGRLTLIWKPRLCRLKLNLAAIFKIIENLAKTRKIPKKHLVAMVLRVYTMFSSL